MVLDTTKASCVWDAAELDKLEDIAREAIEQGRSFRSHIEDLASASAFAQAVRMLHDLLAFIDRAPDPILALDVLRWKFGIYTWGSSGETTSCSDIARKHGVRKQAVSQAARRLRDLLDVRKSAHLRAEDVSVKFATTHFRRRNHEPASSGHPRSSTALPPQN